MSDATEQRPDYSLLLGLILTVLVALLALGVEVETKARNLGYSAWSHAHGR